MCCLFCLAVRGPDGETAAEHHLAVVRRHIALLRRHLRLRLGHIEGLIWLEATIDLVPVGLVVADDLGNPLIAPHGVLVELWFALNV